MVWSWRVPGTVHVLTKKIYTSKYAGTDEWRYTSCMYRKQFATTNQRHYSSSDHYLLLAKKPNISCLVVLGRMFSYYRRSRTQHTCQKTWYSSNTSKPDAASAANKGHGKERPLGWLPPCFGCRRHHPWLFPETWRIVFFKSPLSREPKKQNPIRVAQCSALYYSTYIKMCLIRTQQP